MRPCCGDRLSVFRPELISAQASLCVGLPWRQVQVQARAMVPPRFRGLDDLGLGRFSRLLCLWFYFARRRGCSCAGSGCAAVFGSSGQCPRPPPPRRALRRARQRLATASSVSSGPVDDGGLWLRLGLRAAAIVSEVACAAPACRFAVGDLRRLWLRHRFQIAGGVSTFGSVSHWLGRFCRRLTVGACNLLPLWQAPRDRQHDRCLAVRQARQGRRRIGWFRRRHFHCR